MTYAVGGRQYLVIMAGGHHFMETPISDALVAYALHCRTGKMVALLERSPFEEYEADRLIACDLLGEESGQRLKAMVPTGDWRKMI
jgi:hypothetical protein